jgi:hypothetical protein
MKPRIPIKNNTNERFMYIYLIPYGQV